MHFRLFFSLILGFLSFGLQAQVNLEALSFMVKDYNTLSYTQDYEMVVIGKEEGCLVKKNGEEKYLLGNHATILSEENGICTFGFDKTNNETSVYWYDNNLILINEYSVIGEVNCIAGDNKGEVLYYGVEDFKKLDYYLGKIVLLTGKKTKIHKTNLPLTLVVFENGSIGVGGPITYIFKSNEKFYKEIYMGHLGYLKNDFDSDTLKVLDRISDAAYINLYTKKGDFIKNLKYEHNDSIAKVMCPDCQNRTAMLSDFTVSRNGKAIIAKDQFNTVYQLDENGKFIKYYRLSHNWEFLHFNGHGVLRYFDTDTETVKELRIFHSEE